MKRQDPLAFILALIMAPLILWLVLAPEPDMPRPTVATASVTTASVPVPVGAIAPSSTTSAVDAGGDAVAPRRLAPTGAGSGVWFRLGDCESGAWQRRGDPTSARPGSADWQGNSNGYEGGVHFTHDSWVRAGGRTYAEHAYEAARDEQILIARLWLGRTSVDGQWPTCGPAVGLTMNDALTGDDA